MSPAGVECESAPSVPCAAHTLDDRQASIQSIVQRLEHRTEIGRRCSNEAHQQFEAPIGSTGQGPDEVTQFFDFSLQFFDAPIHGCLVACSLNAGSVLQ